MNRIRSLLVIFAFFAVLAPSTPAGAQNRDLQETGARITAHEWGVWKVLASRIVHLEELAAELPAFVFRAPQSQLPQVPNNPPAVLPAPPLNPIPVPVNPTPRPHPRPPARKPVLFLNTDRATPISVNVSFNGGEPWLYYPDAHVRRAGRAAAGLSWSGRLVPNATAPLAKAPAGHFWDDLRAVGGDLFLSDRGTAERFLFYDGPVRFERPFTISREANGARVMPLSSERRIWMVSPRGYVESRFESGNRSITRGDLNGLRTRLDQELRDRGLTPAEANSLLETWRDDLFRPTRSQAVYFMPRHLYDRMLPISISPAPVELVRVGLVIEDLP